MYDIEAVWEFTTSDRFISSCTSSATQIISSFRLRASASQSERGTRSDPFHGSIWYHFFAEGTERLAFDLDALNVNSQENRDHPTTTVVEEDISTPKKKYSQLSEE
jgi:hypothetical protein